MGLNERMDQFTESQFLSTDKFGEIVKFYKGTDLDESAGVDVTVVWDADAIRGTNEVDGDGVVLDRRTGKRYRQSIFIECDVDLDITEDADPPDRFVRAGEVATVKRVVGYDSGGTKTVLCIRSDGLYDRGKRRMG